MQIVKTKILKSESTVSESTIYDFIALTKPTVTALVVLSSITGIILAPGRIDLVVAIIATTATALASASAAIFNMWYDIDIDSVMERTKTRPLVTKVIEPDDAIVFSLLLGVIAITLMAGCVNYISSLMLFCSIILYCLIYTIWLKRKTDLNIVIGGAAGSLPPIIGWLNVSPNITLEPITLFLIIFFWTPAHFWALAICRCNEYQKCAVPMLPVTKGIDHTKKQILIYTILTVIISIFPYLIGSSKYFYLVCASILGIKFIHIAYYLQKQQGYALSIKVFLYSIFYLFTLLLSLIIDHYVFLTYT